MRKKSWLLIALTVILCGTFSACADDASTQQQSGSFYSWVFWYYAPIFLAVIFMLFGVSRLPHVRRHMRFLARQEAHMDRMEALMERLVSALERKNNDGA